MENLILVSNWEKVEEDDFFLSDEWTQEEKENISKAQKLQKEGNLYVAYIVDAKDYALFTQMDADQVFINADGNIILRCKSAVITNKHDYRIEYEY